MVKIKDELLDLMNTTTFLVITLGNSLLLIALIVSTSALPDQLPNGCPVSPHVHQLLRHETDCDKFYQCSHGQRVLRDCAPGTWFDYDLQVCNWPHLVDCQEHSTTPILEEETQTTFVPTDCPPSANLLLPHEKDCSKFYKCTDAGKVLMQCSPKTLFDFDLQVCNWSDAVDCRTETMTEPTTVQSTITTLNPVTIDNATFSAPVSSTSGQNNETTDYYDTTNENKQTAGPIISTPNDTSETATVVWDTTPEYITTTTEDHFDDDSTADDSESDDDSTSSTNTVIEVTTTTTPSRDSQTTTTNEFEDTTSTEDFEVTDLPILTTENKLENMTVTSQPTTENIMFTTEHTLESVTTDWQSITDSSTSSNDIYTTVDTIQSVTNEAEVSSEFIPSTIEDNGSDDFNDSDNYSTTNKQTATTFSTLENTATESDSSTEYIWLTTTDNLETTASGPGYATEVTVFTTQNFETTNEAITTTVTAIETTPSEVELSTYSGTSTEYDDQSTTHEQVTNTVDTSENTATESDSSTEYSSLNTTDSLETTTSGPEYVTEATVFTTQDSDTTNEAITTTVTIIENTPSEVEPSTYSGTSSEYNDQSTTHEQVTNTVDTSENTATESDPSTEYSSLNTTDNLETTTSGPEYVTEATVFTTQNSDTTNEAITTTVTVIETTPNDLELSTYYVTSTEYNDQNTTHEKVTNTFSTLENAATDSEVTTEYISLTTTDNLKTTTSRPENATQDTIFTTNDSETTNEAITITVTLTETTSITETNSEEPTESTTENEPKNQTYEYDYTTEISILSTNGLEITNEIIVNTITEIESTSNEPGSSSEYIQSTVDNNTTKDEIVSTGTLENTATYSEVTTEFVTPTSEDNVGNTTIESELATETTRGSDTTNEAFSTIDTTVETTTNQSEVTTSTSDDTISTINSEVDITTDTNNATELSSLSTNGNVNPHETLTTPSLIDTTTNNLAFTTNDDSKTITAESSTVMTTPNISPTPDTLLCAPGFFGNVAHPNQCDSYYMCSAGLPIQLFCATGLEFNPITSTCVPISDGGCISNQPGTNDIHYSTTSYFTESEETTQSQTFTSGIDTTTYDSAEHSTPHLMTAVTINPESNSSQFTANTEETETEQITTTYATSVSRETRDVSLGVTDEFYSTISDGSFGTSTETFPSTEGPLCAPGFFGNVAHPQECGSYYMCSAGFPIQLFCTSGYEFDPFSASCKAISEGGCTWQQEPWATESFQSTTEIYSFETKDTDEKLITDVTELYTGSEVITPSFGTENGWAQTTSQMYNTVNNSESTIVFPGLEYSTLSSVSLDVSSGEETSSDHLQSVTEGYFTTVEIETTLGDSGISTETSFTTDAPLCAPGFFGYVAHPRQCDSYYMCSAGFPIQLYCTNGFEFDPVSAVCVLTSEGGCLWTQEIDSRYDGTPTRINNIASSLDLENVSNIHYETIEPNNNNNKSTRSEHLYTYDLFTISNNDGNLFEFESSIPELLLSTEAPLCAPDFFGYLPHQQMCNSYYVCSAGIPLQLFCANGSEFDTASGMCVPVARNGCIREEQAVEAVYGVQSINETYLGYFLLDLNDNSTSSTVSTFPEEATLIAETTPNWDDFSISNYDTDFELTDENIPVCPAEHFGNIPHSELCHSYFMCEGGAPVQLFCPNGNEYNPVLGVCTPTSEGGCSLESAPEEPFADSVPEDMDLDEILCIYNAYVPHPQQCTSYFSCNHGSPPVQLFCDDGLEFDASEQECVPVSDSGCTAELPNSK